MRGSEKAGLWIFIRPSTSDHRQSNAVFRLIPPLLQIDHHVRQKKKLRIVGYYQCNELFEDADLSGPGKRFADKIESLYSNSVAAVVSDYSPLHALASSIVFCHVNLYSLWCTCPPPHPLFHTCSWMQRPWSTCWRVGAASPWSAFSSRTAPASGHVQPSPRGKTARRHQQPRGTPSSAHRRALRGSFSSTRRRGGTTSWWTLRTILRTSRSELALPYMCATHLLQAGVGHISCETPCGGTHCKSSHPGAIDLQGLVQSSTAGLSTSKKAPNHQHMRAHWLHSSSKQVA